jgi:hypothetical protein
MHFVLTLPGILAQPALRAESAPRLARLLAIAGTPARDADGLDAMLAARYGISHEAGADCPLAPVRLAALGVDPGAAFWFAADPVTLVAGRDDVRLAGIVRDLGANDAAALLATMNEHFAVDGLHFIAPHPDAWFMRAPAAVALRTRPAAVAVGRTLRDLLPTGPDAQPWRRWQSEIEMLLHGHPVNAARERDGRASANGIWLSEGGVLPARANDAPAIDTFAGGGVATALAAHARRPARPVPGSFASVQKESRAPSVVVVVALSPPLDLDAVDRDWASPAWDALSRGELDAVTLIADRKDCDGACAWTARRPGRLRQFVSRYARNDLASLLAVTRERP